MTHDVRLRWIAEAEAKSIREFARLRRGVSEPPVSMAPGRLGGTWPASLHRQLSQIVGVPATIPSALRSAATRVATRFGSALRSSADPGFDRVLVAVLITDIVGSTRQAAEMGDRRWSALLDRHDDITRCRIAESGGRYIRNRGDGFLAAFASPTRAIRCAVEIAEATAPLGISLRSGIHAGEIHLQREKINGIAAHVAARIAAEAYPGDVFVSKTVRDLVAGAGFAFDDRGLHGLRGLPEGVHLYSMRTVGEAGDASIVRLRDRRYA